MIGVVTTSGVLSTPHVLTRRPANSTTVFTTTDMENIPLPADSPYEVGDWVRIHLSDDDMDSQYHGLVCEVIDDIPNSAPKLTGRDIDAHHYSLCRVETGNELRLSFRHEDLVPESE